MKNLTSLVLPAVIGLITGIGHGITSHYLDLPLSLIEQIDPSSSFDRSLRSMKLD